LIKYDVKNLQGDIVGGITVAVVALPLALAFGIASMPGSPNGAIAGLYGAIFTGIFATVFGSTNGLINGPTGAMIVVLANAYMSAGPAGFYLAMILAGVFQILLGVFKVGKYIHYIPKPVIIGFTNGIGITIFVQQFHDFSSAPQIAMIVIGIMAIPIIAGMISSENPLNKIFKIVPASLVGIFIASFVAQRFYPSIKYIAEIPKGIPHFIMPQFASIDYKTVVISAVTLCLLASIESLLSGIIVDEMLDQKSNSNKELVGQGIGNIIAPLFGGLIGTGAIVRSAVNVNSGGKTKLSGIIHAIIIFLVVVQFGYVAQLVPMAALAGVLMVTAIKMIEIESIKNIVKIPKSDAFVMIATMLITVFEDLLFAVIAGTIISAIMFTIKIAKHSGTKSRKRAQTPIFIMTVPGPLFFGTVKGLIENIENCKSKVVILNMSRVSVIDETATSAIMKLKDKMSAGGRKLILTRLTAKVVSTIEKMYSNIDEDFILDDAQEATNIAESFVGV